MNKIKITILITICFVVGIIIYQNQKDITPKGYEVLFENLIFNGDKVSVLKELAGDETIILKNGFKMWDIVSLHTPTYVREYYEDFFVFNSINQNEYIIIISSWNSLPRDLPSTVPEYNIYIYDGVNEINGEDQDLIWFGKWLTENYFAEDLTYSELSKQGIISELKKLEEQGKLQKSE